MTATFNPQAAAEQARKNYRDVTTKVGHLGLDTSVPEIVRAMAEKVVDQSREAYGRSNDALDASVATLERTFDAAGQGAVAFNRKIIDIAQRNVNSGFDLAKSLAGAKNLSEMVELQAAYWQKLLDALTSQAEEVRALATKMAATAGEPLKEQVKRGVDGELNGLRRDGNTPRTSADLGPAQFRTTAMTVPHYVNEYTSEIRAIKPGWYGMESNGKLSSGPFSNQGECLTGITQARSNFRASPWLAQAIKCPVCGGEHVRPCTRLDEYGRVWMNNSCETCGHTSPEDIGRRVVN